jgi:hypothetical protein
MPWTTLAYFCLAVRDEEKKVLKIVTRVKVKKAKMNFIFFLSKFVSFFVSFCCIRRLTVPVPNFELKKILFGKKKRKEK